MSYNLKIPKWIIEISEDTEQNIHNLTAKQIADRLYNRKWSMEKILKTPIMTRSQAGSLAAKKSPWGKWNPGEFSDADAERRKELPSWKD